MATQLTIEDFFTGILSAISLKDLGVISLRQDRFDKALAEAFESLKVEAAKLKLDLRFRIKLHTFHGDSQTIRNGISGAAQRDLISLDNPEYQKLRLKISREEADSYLSSIPGGHGLFIGLAEKFLNKYYGVEDTVTE